MANVHLIGGEKGGVGKSVVARLLAQYFIDRELPFLGFDADRSHAALLRFYEGYASPVVVDRYESLDAIVEAAAAEPDRRILVDLAAQTHEPLTRWMDESGLPELAAETGFKLRYWHVMDSGKDSVDLLVKLLDRYGARLDYVLVLNELRGDDFSILERSGAQGRAQALGAKVVSLRKLHDASMRKIDASSASFWAASHSSDGASGSLGLVERQRVRVWLKQSYEALDSHRRLRAAGLARRRGPITLSRAIPCLQKRCPRRPGRPPATQFAALTAEVRWRSEGAGPSPSRSRGRGLQWRRPPRAPW